VQKTADLANKQNLRQKNSKKTYIRNLVNQQIQGLNQSELSEMQEKLEAAT
jgi:hypothetical protein